MAPRVPVFKGERVNIRKPSLLSYTELLGLVRDGVIENCPFENVNGASVDVSLAPNILVEANGDVFRALNFREREPLVTRPVTIDPAQGYPLRPGEFVLASTEQIFNLPDTLAVELRMKSSAARVGLNNVLACWADPTWHGSALTLELKNETRYHTLLLRPGDRVAQVIFQRCAPVPEAASYAVRGRYNRDRTVVGIKP
jgi:dCTP deaminase